MADLFLARDDRVAIRSSDRFRIAVLAKHEDEVEVERIIKDEGLTISVGKKDKCVRSTSTCLKIYSQGGSALLARTLQLLYQSFYGAAESFDAPLLNAMALLIQRYDGTMVDSYMIEKLHGITGGINGLLAKAETIRLAVRRQKTHCIAAAMVDAYNVRAGNKRLESWWS
jgi:hypothetical protein